MPYICILVAAARGKSEQQTLFARLPLQSSLSSLLPSLTPSSSSSSPYIEIVWSAQREEGMSRALFARLLPDWDFPTFNAEPQLKIPNDRTFSFAPSHHLTILHHQHLTLPLWCHPSNIILICKHQDHHNHLTISPSHNGVIPPLPS